MGMNSRKDIGTNSGETTSLLQRYFDGNISHREFLELKAGQKGMSEKEITEAMERMWDDFDSRESAVPKELFATITDKINKKPYRTIRYWITAAAVLLFCIGGAVLKYSLYDDPSYKVYATNDNETLNITLPDGSVARLNKNTEIRSFGTDDVSVREVELLRGEVLFHVTKNADRTFLVKVGNMEVSVLGTVFNVKDTGAGGKVETTLLSGKVKLTQGGEKKGVFLEAGEKAVFNKQEGAFSVEKSQVNENNIWKEADLAFRSTSLPDVFSIIEAHYGVKIRVNKATQPADTYTSSFEAISLDDLMKILSIHFNFNYKIDGEVVQVDF